MRQSAQRDRLRRMRRHRPFGPAALVSRRGHDLACEACLADSVITGHDDAAALGDDIARIRDLAARPTSGQDPATESEASITYPPPHA